MDRLERTRVCHTCGTRQQESPDDQYVTQVQGCGQSVMLYQQALPLPNTHRFVRLLLSDAGRGVQSVRPAHQGYHQGSHCDRECDEDKVEECT